MAKFWLVETADSFWEAVGEPASDFETAVLFALPIGIERIAGLTLHSAHHWLTRYKCVVDDIASLPDRPLRACLVAQGQARNFILLDKNDPSAEQAFSLAHEVAHFLLDYVRPRQKATGRMSKSILEVLDGLRQPTLNERLEGVLAGVKLTPYQHFMERSRQGDILNASILEAELQADCLSLELLAPEELVLPLVATNIAGQPTYAARLTVATRLLVETFALPPSIARPYATRLVKEAGGAPGFREWLNL